MSGPDRIWAGYAGDSRYWVFDDYSAKSLGLTTEYIRRDPAVLAELPEVQSMIAEAVAKERGDLEHPITAYTFAVQHNPNCPSPWLVRMPGKSGMIDMKPYRGFHLTKEDMTGDLLAFGRTFKDAADAAIRKRGEGQP